MGSDAEARTLGGGTPSPPLEETPPKLPLEEALSEAAAAGEAPLDGAGRPPSPGGGPRGLPELSGFPKGEREAEEW